MERERVDSLVELAANIAGHADEIDDIIVLYTRKGEPGIRVLENGITAAEGIFLMEAFKHDLLSKVCLNDSD
jgi:hypothetical protein